MLQTASVPSAMGNAYMNCEIKMALHGVGPADMRYAAHAPKLRQP